MLWRFSLNRTSRRTTAFKAQRQTTYRASYVSPLPAVVKQQPGVTGQQSSLSHSLYGSEILSVTESQIMQVVNTHNYYILRCMWILWLTKMKESQRVIQMHNWRLVNWHPCSLDPAPRALQSCQSAKRLSLLELPSLWRLQTDPFHPAAQQWISGGRKEERMGQQHSTGLFITLVT